MGTSGDKNCVSLSSSSCEPGAKPGSMINSVKTALAKTRHLGTVQHDSMPRKGRFRSVVHLFPLRRLSHDLARAAFSHVVEDDAVTSDLVDTGGSFSVLPLAPSSTFYDRFQMKSRSPIAMPTSVFARTDGRVGDR